MVLRIHGMDEVGVRFPIGPQFRKERPDVHREVPSPILGGPTKSVSIRAIMENQEIISNDQKVYSFEDGNFSFWEGEVDGNIVVIRVREDDKASMRWVEKGLPRGITIHPASIDHIRQWQDGHPEYKPNN